MLKAIFFDLDGTLLPMDENAFTKLYVSLLAKKMIPYGYDKDKLINGVLKGYREMIVNQDGRKRFEVFFDLFSKEVNKDALKDIEVFNNFYKNEFLLTKQACKDNPLAKTIIDFCHTKNLLTVLSTNPIFPRVATLSRMSFVGLKESDFDYITDYENSIYTKPNPAYFENLLTKFNLTKDEVILFGNDTLEDGDCASSLGIKVYLLNHSLIKKENTKGNYDIISLDDVIPTIQKEIENRNNH